MIQERSEIDKKKTFVSIYHHKNYTTHHNPWTWKKGRVWGSDFTNLKSHKNPDLQFTDQLFLTDQFPISPWLWNHKIQFLNESCKILSLKQRQLPQNSQGWHKRLHLWQAKKNDNPKYSKKKKQAGSISTDKSPKAGSTSPLAPHNHDLYFTGSYVNLKPISYQPIALEL